MLSEAPPHRFPTMPQQGKNGEDLLKMLHDDYENCGKPLERLLAGKVPRRKEEKEEEKEEEEKM